MNIEMVDRGDVESVWPRVERYFVQACAHEFADLTPGDIKRCLLGDANWQLLVLENGAAAVILLGDTLHIEALGGHRLPKGWVKDLQLWLQVAGHVMGASRATLCGRKGWQRALKPLGWRPVANGFLECELW